MRWTLFALWAGHDLLIPVDVIVCLAEPFCGVRLPTRICNDLADHDNPIALLAVDQHAAAGVAHVDQMFRGQQRTLRQ